MNSHDARFELMMKDDEGVTLISNSRGLEVTLEPGVLEPGEIVHLRMTSDGYKQWHVGKNCPGWPDCLKAPGEEHPPLTWKRRLRNWLGMKL